MAYTNISSEDRLEQATLAGHLEQVQRPPHFRRHNASRMAVGARRDNDADQYRRNTRRMEQMKLLSQKQDSEHGAEGGQQVQRHARRVGAEHRHATIPAHE